MSARVLLLVLLVVLGVAAPARADTPAMLARLAETVLVPRYEALATVAEAQEREWDRFCAAPGAAGLADLRAAYRRAADAWSAIELVRYGAAGEDFRADRLSYWPERKNATARGLAQLLADTVDMTPSRIRQASAAAQGLPAIERLLFGDPAPGPRDFEGSGEGGRRCDAGRAIAGNVARLAAEMRDGWRKLAPRLGEPGRSDEAARRLATDLMTAFQVARDIKLLPPLGQDPGSARPRLAEGWRSGRPATALVLSIEAAEAMARAMLAEAGPSNALLAIRQARRIAEGLPRDFAAFAHDTAARRQGLLLFDALGGARDALLAELPPALGISLGFNSLDGD